MNKQEVFNKVVTHLRTQGVPAKRGCGDCAYRSADGLMCAVGCLIPANMYDSNMEGQLVAELIDNFPEVAEALEIEDIEDEGFLRQLQFLHDQVNPVKWEEAWQKIAKQFNLQMPVDSETV